MAGAVLVRPDRFWHVVIACAVLASGMFVLGFPIFDEWLVGMATLGALAAVLARRVPRRDPTSAEGQRAWAFLFLALCGVLLLQSLAGAIAYANVKALRFSALFALLGTVAVLLHWYAFPVPRPRRVSLFIALLSGGYLLLYILHGLLFREAFYVYSMDGIGGAGAAYATFPVVVGLPAAMLLLRERALWQKLLGWGILGLALAVGALSDSRGAVGVVALYALAMPFALGFRWWATRAVPGVAAAAILVGIVAFGNAAWAVHMGEALHSSLDVGLGTQETDYYGEHATFARGDGARLTLVWGAVHAVSSEPQLLLVGAGSYGFWPEAGPYVDGLRADHGAVSDTLFYGATVGGSPVERPRPPALAGLIVEGGAPTTALVAFTSLLAAAWTLLRVRRPGIDLVPAPRRNLLVAATLAATLFWAYFAEIQDAVLAYLLIMPHGLLAAWGAKGAVRGVAEGASPKRVAFGEVHDYVEVTEISGEMVTQEQVQRAVNRYAWAAQHVVGRHVLEVACGSGQGIGLLSEGAASVVAIDVSRPLLKRARWHYGSRHEIVQADAQRLPFDNQTFDAIVCFEAIYYLPDAGAFVEECRRVLRPGGVLLVASANPDLYDFNPSPYSQRYYGCPELRSLVAQAGFSAQVFGDTLLDSVSWRQRLLRPAKWVAVQVGAVPGTMRAKRLIKRLVFGTLRAMPAELTVADAAPVPPTALDGLVPDRRHKVIFCAAVAPSTAEAGRHERSVVVRPATRADLPAIAAIHRESLATALLARLGPRAVQHFYARLLRYPSSIILVVVDETGIVGFAAGARSALRFYRGVHRSALAMVIAAFPALVCQPSLLVPLARRASMPRSRTFGDPEGTVQLMSIALRRDQIGLGIGQKLLEAFLARAREDGARFVYATTEADDNQRANSLYQRNEFRAVGTTRAADGRLLREYRRDLEGPIRMEAAA